MTLARLRGVRQAAVADYLAARGALIADSFTAERFVLYSARDGSGGGPYVVEAAYPLEWLRECHCEERSDEAIRDMGALVPGLLRFARNDDRGLDPNAACSSLVDGACITFYKCLIGPATAARLLENAPISRAELNGVVTH